jgi:hypothetical protein
MDDFMVNMRQRLKLLFELLVLPRLRRRHKQYNDAINRTHLDQMDRLEFFPSRHVTMKSAANEIREQLVVIINVGIQAVG